MYRIKRKLTSVKNPQANAILERFHGVLCKMLRTSKLDMAELVKASDIDVFFVRRCMGRSLYLPYSA
jgi:hypothetical protein